ncbi:membrane-anchored ubiquitin-fold protein 1 isoform X1 [Arachis duranensis]|uniref:Membrane-anchored ubiquitin-fold protein 1 isoform X1 n=1 Tax=Arachis duranensis TaxID=130453 RepID=A0A6P5NLT0_ARADU|nr:membrane-anchored ubiquitin-fold protein 1 isoform X1 [Arachis duranensis]XP_025696731.1 membrane-anchored ubiquitin-fold protein 1 isoform X1 [Arachis hypogaea]
MAGNQDQLEIKFRLIDGSDIGPKSFPVATSIATLKESIVAQWPKDKENGPRTVKDVKLISAGKILENNKTVGECQSPLCDAPDTVTTMHVVVQPPTMEKDKEYSTWRRSQSYLFQDLSACGRSAINFLHSFHRRWFCIFVAGPSI